MPPQKKIKPGLILCPNNHQNSPNAVNCWVCGKPLAAPPKPKFEQKTNTTVTTYTPPTPPAQSNYVDLNFADPECDKYVTDRKRCDEKDPSGHYCVWFTSCARRLARFNNPKAYAKVEEPQK